MPTIIVKNGVAVYGPGVTLTAEHADGGRFIDPTTRLDNAELIEIDALPEHFQGGGFTWDGSELTIRPEYEQTLPVPQSVTALQGMRAIARAGLTEAFIAWKAGLDSVADFEAIAFLEKAQTWQYDDETLNAALVLLGATEQKDALFRLAATL